MLTVLLLSLLCGLAAGFWDGVKGPYWRWT